VKLSLKAVELQADQRHEDVERKWGFSHIIIFRAWTYGMMVLPEVK
jgi:hypothetical protein